MAKVTDSMLKGYMKAALWSSTDEDDEPLDRNYSTRDVSSEAKRAMRSDIARFIRSNKKVLQEYVEYHGWESAGHDLWLTRNGHGAGFWDRDYDGHDEIGKKLTIGAKTLGTSDLYAGDDGKLYVFPMR